jgi:hypothetical protein
MRTQAGLLLSCQSRHKRHNPDQAKFEQLFNSIFATFSLGNRNFPHFAFYSSNLLKS